MGNLLGDGYRALFMFLCKTVSDGLCYARCFWGSQEHLRPPAATWGGRGCIEQAVNAKIPRFFHGLRRFSWNDKSLSHHCNQTAVF